ncbi:hypothetical protein ACTL7K_15450, partial [Brevibacterium linens]
NQRIVSMVHLGRGVFGSDFGSVAFVVSTAKSDGGRAVYRRLFEQHVDVRSVSTIEALFLDRDYNRFEVAQSDFSVIPGSPIVYWLSEKMRRSFATGRPLSQVANLRQGLATADNNRFLRQWWEVPAARTAFSCTSREEAVASGARWFPYNKGGEFRKWYGNQEHVINWERDGAELFSFRPRAVIRNPSTYFSPSVSWSKVSSGSPAFRAYPAGFIFDVAGTSIFTSNSRDHLGLLGFANSQMALEQLAAIAPTLNYEVGQVAGLPVVAPDADQVVRLASSAVATAKRDWNSYETSWEFQDSPIVELSRQP